MTVEKDLKNNDKASASPCNGAACDVATISLPICRKRSFGEKVFDWGAYGATGVATLLVSVFSGYSSRYGKGAKALEPLVESAKKIGMSHAVANDVVMTVALGLGGIATLPLIKGLENKKVEIVNAINENSGCGGETYVQEHGHKISWTHLLKARVAAFSAVFASFRGAAWLVGEEPFAQFEKSFAKQMVCKPLNRPTHINGQETKLFKYGRIVSLDLFATVAATLLLYMGSRFFADKETGIPKCVKLEDLPPNALPAAAPATSMDAAAPEKSFVDKINSQQTQSVGLAL